MIPNVFSSEDLNISTFMKYYFEAYGFVFPLQFEIIYSKITETHSPRDSSKIAKKALFFPQKMRTPVRQVPTFDATDLEYFLEGEEDFWIPMRAKPLQQRIEQILKARQ